MTADSRPSQAALSLSLLACAWATSALAEEKPFNQEEWQRRVYEIDHPKPGDPKLEAALARKAASSTRCIKSFIFRNAKVGFSVFAISEKACQSCDKELREAGVAKYNADTISHPLNADKDDAIKFYHDICGQVALQEALNREIDLNAAKFMELNKVYHSKIATAMDCSQAAASVYAQTTTETAEAIAIASFDKCKSVWGEAADFALQLYPNLSEFDRWDALKHGWHDRAISAVVDERARQNLGESPPSERASPAPEQKGTGI